MIFLVPFQSWRTKIIKMLYWKRKLYLYASTKATTKATCVKSCSHWHKVRKEPLFPWIQLNWDFLFCFGFFVVFFVCLLVFCVFFLFFVCLVCLFVVVLLLLLFLVVAVVGGCFFFHYCPKFSKMNLDVHYKHFIFSNDWERAYFMSFF